MGYLDAIGANTFRPDSQGRLVFAPRGRRGRAYIVPSEQAAAYLRFQRRYYLAMFVALPLAVVLLQSVWAVGGVGLVWLAGFYLKLWSFTRRLESAAERPEVTRVEAIDRAARSMGARTLAVVAVLGAAMAAASIWVLTENPRSIGAWIGAVYFTGVTLLYVLRWRQVRRRRAAT